MGHSLLAGRGVLAGRVVKCWLTIFDDSQQLNSLGCLVKFIVMVYLISIFRTDIERIDTVCAYERHP